MAKTITVRTVQGIGDLFWVYQKLAPHFDTINLDILCIGTSPVQQRAQAFCAMLPKVRHVAYRVVRPTEYQRVAQTTFALADVIRAAPGAVDYAVNAPLERGRALRELDDGAAIEEFVDLRGVPTAAPPREDYLCVFVAGAKAATVWQPAQWAPVIERLAGRMGTRRIVLVGAAWDIPVQDLIQSMLQRRRYVVTSQVASLDLAGTLDVIRRARFFLGYQSGLNVLADNYDVPQLMLYFPPLRPMLYTWAKPANVGTRFHAMTFADNPAPVVDALSL